MKFVYKTLASALAIIFLSSLANAKDVNWKNMEYSMAAMCASAHHKDLIDLYESAVKNEDVVVGPKFQERINDCLDIYDLPKQGVDEDRLVAVFLVATKGRTANCIISKSPDVDQEEASSAAKRSKLTAKSKTYLSQCDTVLATRIAEGDNFAEYLLQAAIAERQIWNAKVRILKIRGEEQPPARKLAVCSWERAEIHSKAFFIKSGRGKEDDLSGLFRTLVPELIGRCAEYANGVNPTDYLREFLEVGVSLGGYS